MGDPAKLCEACVHGRFQPPHNGHLEYLLAAKERCDFLWVGITRYNIRQAVPCGVDPHRAAAMANVLTYFERVEIITQMLLDVGVSRATFACTPFPVDEPVLLPDFISTRIPCLTTVYDEWNLEKNRVLSTLGYQTIVLYERATKAIEGSVIRQSILDGDSTWIAQVPEATVRAADRLGLRDRLRGLSVI